MTTIDNPIVVQQPAPMETTPPAPTEGYAAVRYNALKHGILSGSVVLPYEDEDAFSRLLAALIEEHRPAGMTEQHLVEDLAAIIWRKRRVLLAEGAQINSGLKSAVSSPRFVVPAAAPLERGISGEGVDLSDLLAATPDEIAERRHEAELDLAASQRAATILRKRGVNAYENARRALVPDSRDWWDRHVEEEAYPATAEGLEDFLFTHLMPLCARMEKELRHQPEIKAQTLGEGVQAHRLEKLARYETHLDRKFERTLAMLLRLKDLRGT
jgi:hypothetical protein